MRTSARSTGRWLVRVHQLPAKPDYLRVKIGRRLSRLGAVAIQNSVYVLPHDPERLEDLRWLLREIADGGGEGTLISARFLGGLDDDGVEAMFRAARDEECAPLLDEARALLARGRPDPEGRSPLEADPDRKRTIPPRVTWRAVAPGLPAAASRSTAWPAHG